jgi:putative tryptophan/tyrosine transport system substrate-binding protein
MDRRRFLLASLAGALAAPLGARAQASALRITVLGSGAAQSSGIFVDALKEGLRDNGLVESRDYVLDVRWAEGDYTRFPAFAREAVEGKASLILATTIAAVRAAQRATTTIPIVMTTINDPVGVGLVPNLARPGGNTTGIANLTEDVTPKVVEILRAVVPAARTVAVLFNPGNPSNRLMRDTIRTQAGSKGLEFVPIEMKIPADLDAAFEALAPRRADALLVINDATILDQRERVVALALRHRLPAFSSFPEFTAAGAVASYGPSRLKLYRRSAYYVRRIVEGAKPGDLPIEQPTQIELSVNLKTARSLGLTIPPSLLLRADQVIE